MKRPHRNLSRPHLKPAFDRLTGWLRHEKAYEQQTFVEGIANVDSLVGAIIHGIGSLVTLIGRTIVRAAVWPFMTLARLSRTGFRRAVAKLKQALHELTVVVGEIVQDIRHLIATSGQAVIWFIRRLLSPFVKLGGIMTAPIRHRFAKQAKAQALSDVTMTSDRHAHWELLALVAVALVATGGLLIVTGHTATLTNLAHSAAAATLNLNPTSFASWLANATPSALALSGAGVVLAGLSVWFWVRMTLDAWRRNYPTHLEQTRWRTVTTLLFIPGAVAYFLQVYNHWGLRQFIAYHVSAVLMVGTAVLVVTSTYGTLWYFNRQADAIAEAPPAGVPNLALDQATRQSILNRPQYGAPLQLGGGGRVDPFAPVPGQTGVAPPSPSPSPSASPTP